MSEILKTLLSTLLEAVDSKKAMVALSSALASSLTLLAGHQGWAWLDQNTADLIAGAVTAHAVAFVAAQSHVDKAKLENPAPSVVTITATGLAAPKPSAN